MQSLFQDNKVFQSNNKEYHVTRRKTHQSMLILHNINFTKLFSLRQLIFLPGVSNGGEKIKHNPRQSGLSICVRDTRTPQCVLATGRRLKNVISYSTGISFDRIPDQGCRLNKGQDVSHCKSPLSELAYVTAPLYLVRKSLLYPCTDKTKIKLFPMISVTP